ncbi:MAG: protein-L-isoaspartate(D-aspartate) O-methyltransferase, partial [Actinoplanes sp.]|nr:protein-L-isoaspartate(D-aspartate) O-methyltransferase [Actinoplanes sp.]
MDTRSDRYVAEIRRGGAVLSDELARAFAAVPREVFVGEGFQRRDGSWARPGDEGFLDTVYSDEVLVTKVDGKTPVSSSSQPSLMAVMLAALRVRPGLRVLEIGAGTGYNAALLATLGAQVTSVDVQADVARRASAALAAAGVGGVRVVHDDGYAAVPGEVFDRVIVTVGVAGLSPYWVAGLAGAGPLVVPVEHGGTHPVLVAWASPDGPASLAGPSGPSG